MARAQGARATLAAAFETTYGTKPTNGFKKMPFSSFGVGAEQPLIDSNTLGLGRDAPAPIKDRVNVDGAINVPIDTAAFGFWLKAVFGNVTTTGTTIFTHKVHSGEWEIPSFSMEVGMPEVPRYALYEGCKVDSLSWSFGTSGNLDATVSVIAQGEDVATNSSAGSLANWTQKRFGHFNGEIKRNNVLMANAVSASINYENNLDKIETIRSDGKISGIDPSMSKLSGDLTVRFSSTDLIDQAINGNSCSLNFNYEISANEYLKITIPEVYLPRPKVEIQGPEGIQVQFDWQAAKPAGATKMITIEYKNNVASY